MLSRFKLKYIYIIGILSIIILIFAFIYKLIISSHDHSIPKTVLEAPDRNFKRSKIFRKPATSKSINNMVINNRAHRIKTLMPDISRKPDKLKRTRRRKNFIAKHASQETININYGASFNLSRLRAIERDNFKADMGQENFLKHGFVFFLPDNTKSTTKLIIEPGMGLPVIHESHSNKPVIVTGNFVIKLEDFSYLDSLVSKLNLGVYYTAGHLNLAILSAPEGSDLLEVLEKLQNDPFVNSAKLELIDYLEVPQ